MTTNLLLNGYTWSDSSNNKWAICNSKFVNGTLRPSRWVQNNSTWYTVAGSKFGSLDVSSISHGNVNLVNLDTSFADKDTTTTSVYRKTIKVNVKGIYRLRVTLTFTGIFDGTTETFKFTLSNSVYNGESTITNNADLNMNTTCNYPNITTLSNNEHLSFGYIYSTSTESTNFLNTSTVNFGIDSVGDGGNLGSTTLTNNGLSVIENILFLNTTNALYFNISGESTTNTSYANATGNFTLELLYAT
jgi:hypothetical protein